MTLWKKENAKKVIEILMYCTLFVLFVHFSFIEQYDAFVSKRSTIASRYLEANVFEFPTITICLHPATKLSVSKKYGFKDMYNKFYVESSNATFSERFDELSYILNKDFVIQDYKGQNLQVGSNVMADPYLFRKISFDITALRTYFYGTCYKLQPTTEIFNLPSRMLFKVILNQDLDEMDRPNSVILHLTSNKTWLGVVDNMWPQFEPLTVKVMMHEEFTQFRISITEKYYQEKAIDNKKCLKDVLLSTNCSNPCFLTSYGDLPPCETVDQFNCMYMDLFSTNDFRNCHKTNLATTYKLNQRIDNPPHQTINQSRTLIYVALWNNMIEVQEEVPLLTPELFVGSIGGSLGLLFGFSISGSLFFFIQLLINKVLK